MENKKDELKRLFTAYWEFLTLSCACRFHIFDEIENGNNTIEKLGKSLNVNLFAFTNLIHALIEIEAISLKNNILYLTEKSKYLTSHNPESLKNACILWSEEHLTAWKSIDYTIKTGQSAFENLYGKNYFDYILPNKSKLVNYQLAMQEYALDDYKNISQIIDFEQYNTISDIGGGMGALIKFIAKKYPEKNYILFELHEVIETLQKSDYQGINLISGNFFSPFPFTCDAIILSRILHDWNDEQASIVLNNCNSALSENGTLFIIEIANDEIKANLLTLNMMIMCNSFERTFEQYQNLVEKNGFTIENRLKFNDLQTVLKCKKI